MIYNLKSQLLEEFQHGFFLRQGGFSTGPFKSLNCDLNSKDEKSSILLNRATVAKNMNLQPANLITLKQIHSSRVIKIETPIDSNLIEGDAMVTSSKGIGLGILTADCAPVIFAENMAKVIGIAHVGWRGAFDSIIENTILKMIELGAEIKFLKAVIGPCIQKENYEIGAEFLERFSNKYPNYLKYFNIDKNKKIWFDLPGLILEKMRNLGINTSENLGKCTFALSDDFFSHRRNQKYNLVDCGRMISAIKM